VAAARMNDVAAIDGVFNAIDDLEGFRRQCAQAVEFGFDGKTLVHPNQIEASNIAFSPTDEELAWARAITAAFEQPENRALGAIRIDGRMVERLHMEEARRLLSLFGDRAEQAA
jgi:citrate lyase subunit beta/citryl-CoA lyase